jgi:hypothetical protein
MVQAGRACMVQAGRACMVTQAACSAGPVDSGSMLGSARGLETGLLRFFPLPLPPPFPAPPPPPFPQVAPLLPRVHRRVWLEMPRPAYPSSS